MMNLRLLIDRQTIADRVRVLGSEITEYYSGKPLTLVVLLNGAMLFASDLARHIELDDVYLDSISASSYSNDASSGNLKIRSQLKLPVQGRHILLIDDILDTGCTLATVKQYFEKMDAASVRTCVLLNKQLDGGKIKQFPAADWTGFTIPDLYVLGYGLDSMEKYRNLPDICVKE